MKIVIFGGGLQGLVIANNLRAREEKPEIVIADIVRPAGLAEDSHIKWVKADVLAGEQVKAVVSGASACVLAVPSSIAHQALANIIACGVPVADVSFTPDPPLSLSEAARKSGSSCIVDCGVAPGLSHILVGHAYKQLSGLDKVTILVGGMPQKPPAVFHHAVYFNPCDLLAEYVRPARARTKGKDIAPHPLEAPIEPYHDSDLGAIESFLSDGLRSLVTSFPDIPCMEERTLRWQGHLRTMKDLNELGFFLEGMLPNTAQSINNKYPGKDFPDYLLMVVEAEKGSRKLAWRLLDKETDGISAMSRTTGFTTAAVAMVLARGQFKEPGVHPPEVLGQDAAMVELILADLAERGVKTKELVNK